MLGIFFLSSGEKKPQTENGALQSVGRDKHRVSLGNSIRMGRPCRSFSFFSILMLISSAAARKREIQWNAV